jgi:hypothetical protein
VLDAITRAERVLETHTCVVGAGARGVETDARS